MQIEVANDKYELIIKKIVTLILKIVNNKKWNYFKTTADGHVMKGNMKGETIQ